MKTFLFFIAGLAMLPFIATAQYNNGERRGDHGYERHNDGNRETKGEAGSAFTIFSESGDRFYLILNDVKQNTNPQTRVRVEGLPMVVNDIQIVFDDNMTPSIRRRMTLMDPLDGKAVNLVLKIYRDRDGRAYLAFQKLTPLERDYRGEQGEYVMNYGKDNGNWQPHNDVPVTPPPPAPPVPAGPQAMDATSFQSVKKTIQASSWDDTKLSTAKTIAASNYFTTEQVMQICKLFQWDESKLDFAKSVYSKTIDQSNYFKIGTLLSWDSDKNALNDFISSNPPH